LVVEHPPHQEYPMARLAAKPLPAAVLALLGLICFQCRTDRATSRQPNVRDTISFVANLTDLGNEPLAFDPTNPCVITATASTPAGFCIGADGRRMGQRFQSKRFSFGDLNPDSVRVSRSRANKHSNIIHLRTTNAKKTIQRGEVCRAGTGEDRSTTALDSTLELVIAVEGDAEKVQKALLHVIHECHGQKDLF
jgi:hypothetical protein